MLCFQHFTKSPFVLFRKTAAILYNICTTKVMLYFGTAIACRKNLFEMPGMGFLECDSSWESHCSPETSFGSPSKELHGDMRTGLCVRKSMMMACQVVPASRCHCLELMIRKAATEMPTGCGQCIVKNIVRMGFCKSDEVSHIRLDDFHPALHGGDGVALNAKSNTATHDRTELGKCHSSIH